MLRWIVGTVAGLIFVSTLVVFGGCDDERAMESDAGPDATLTDAYEDGEVSGQDGLGSPDLSEGGEAGSDLAVSADAEGSSDAVNAETDAGNLPDSGESAGDAA